MFHSYTEFAIYNGFEYYIAGTDSDDTDDFLEFDASREFCVDWGGQLTSIVSQGEADFLTSHMYVRAYNFRSCCEQILCSYYADVAIRQTKNVLVDESRISRKLEFSWRFAITRKILAVTTEFKLYSD